MAINIFDKVKINAGTKVYDNDFPQGKVTVTPYEVQICRVCSEDQSPEGFGEIVTWRVPGKELDRDQPWAPSSGVTVTVPRDYP